jgi:hypothetical protein
VSHLDPKEQCLDHSALTVQRQAGQLVLPVRQVQLAEAADQASYLEHLASVEQPAYLEEVLEGRFRWKAN